MMGPHHLHWKAWSKRQKTHAFTYLPAIRDAADDEAPALDLEPLFLYLFSFDCLWDESVVVHQKNMAQHSFLAPHLQIHGKAAPGEGEHRSHVVIPLPATAAGTAAYDRRVGCQCNAEAEDAWEGAKVRLQGAESVFFCG